MLNVYDMREAVNIVIFIMSLPLALLFIRTIIQSFPLDTKHMVRNAWIALGWLFICVGEGLRSFFIWNILHFGQSETYLMQIVPLVVSLVCIVVGFMIIIKMFTPKEWSPHSVWLPTLGMVILALTLNWVVL